TRLALQASSQFDGVISLVYVDDTRCNVFLYWCVDWILHRFSSINFIYPPLPFIMLVIVFFDSTMVCSIPISISVSLPLPLIHCDELISLVWYLELSFDISLFLSLLCGIQVLMCSVLALWYFTFMEFVLLPILSSTLCGSGVGNVLLKIRDISNTKVLIKGFVAMLKIVDCAFVAASILVFISLIVVSNF
ncbi:hypothetical protein HID58_090246, partial [Brassica napus]